MTIIIKLTKCELLFELFKKNNTLDNIEKKINEQYDNAYRVSFTVSCQKEKEKKNQKMNCDQSPLISKIGPRSKVNFFF